MFEQVLKAAATLPQGRRAGMMTRLDNGRRHGHPLGCGVGGDLHDLRSHFQYGVDP
jgi:hypothetical protein